MGVKNLWGIISATGHKITVGVSGSSVVKNGNESCMESNIEKLHISDENPESGRRNTSGEAFNGHFGASLSGKAIAIDLSCWVCDSQANQNMHSVTKPHLR